ncbi:ABC transporter substrate binding protein [Photobacterium chitinilyticum]|uniref:diguanylate cyclase n=1 Tax=Photobacterium chitinilyticum TaxID=2485123 RepID=A0A3S3R3D4_9GAMM|nr:ABC transporter substrate binding protein [Photobacterium chitinilyticum]RWX57425.1 diguanylate cyclase [Photobacterium chitinilyticum]
MTTKTLLFFLWFTPLLASARDEPVVLLINSYHPQYQWTSQLTQGIKDVLITSVSTENLHTEYMDKRRFVDDLVYHAKLINLLKHKYQRYEPDIIITTDDHAYNFMLEHGDSLFPDKPIVFSGVNILAPETLERKRNIVGIEEGMEIEGNLELILQVQPQTKRIIMLSDTTGLGLNMGQRARQIKSQWQTDPEKQHVTLDIWDQFSIDELYQKAESAESDTVFLMLAIHKDKLGTYFSYEHHLPILTRKSKVPVYGMWGTIIIGYSGLGGMMNNPYDQGRSAAQLAVKILDGVPLSNINALDTANYSPSFDYNQLKRFDIDLNHLPINSTIINRPVSLYEQHTRLINSAIAFVLFLLIVISVLTFNIKRRIAAQHKLHQFNQELESIVQQRTKDLDNRNKELQAASKILQAHAYTDELTGLPNRRAASRDVLAHIKRYNMDYQPLAIAILDIDLFKNINDTYGHQAGDEVLCAVGQTLKELLRPNDSVYRWGGEEFLVVLPDTVANFSFIVCQRLTNKISQLSVSNIDSITASIGVTNFIKGDSFETILQRADKALYTAKNSGRNQVVIG